MGDSLVLLTQFAGYLLSRIEAIENILIEADPALKERLRAAAAAAEASLGRHLEMPRQDEASREHAIADILRRLRSRLPDRLV